MCVAVFSVEAGKEVECGDDGMSAACASTKCENNDAGKSVCVAAYKTEGALPRPCVDDANCTSAKLGDKTIEGKCNCAENGEGTAVCALFPGDAIFAKSLSTMKKILSAS
jgi:hypothetical protein